MLFDRKSAEFESPVNDEIPYNAWEINANYLSFFKYFTGC